MKNKYIVYGTFEVEVEANSEEEAKSQFDIDDADVDVQGCYRLDDEEEREDTWTEAQGNYLFWINSTKIIVAVRKIIQEVGKKINILLPNQ